MFNKVEVMKRAWQIKKEDASYIFGLCLKMAWAEIKTGKGKEMTTEERITELEGKGFKRWTKGNLDRLYINASQLGLVCSYYNTGNVSSATFQGDRISNCEARRMKAAKTFVDVKTWVVYSDNSSLKKAAEELAGLAA